MRNNNTITSQKVKIEHQKRNDFKRNLYMSIIHISEPTRLLSISYADL